MHDCEYINCQGVDTIFKWGGRGFVTTARKIFDTIVSKRIIHYFQLFSLHILAIQLSLGWRQLEFHLTLTIPYTVCKSLLQGGHPPSPIYTLDCLLSCQWSVFDSLFLQYSFEKCDFGVKGAKTLGEILSNATWIQLIK